MDHEAPIFPIPFTHFCTPFSPAHPVKSTVLHSFLRFSMFRRPSFSCPSSERRPKAHDLPSPFSTISLTRVRSGCQFPPALRIRAPPVAHLQGGLPWEPVQRGIEKAPSRSDLTLPFDSLFGTRSARFGRTTCAAAVREEQHRCYALVWLMTSSTKLSSRFWSPSPISNRAKLSTLNRPPIICLTETS